MARTCGVGPVEIVDETDEAEGSQRNEECADGPHEYCSPLLGSPLLSRSFVLEGEQTESRNFDLRSRSILRGARCALERTNTAAAGSDRSAARRRSGVCASVCLLNLDGGLAHWEVLLFMETELGLPGGNGVRLG